MIRLEWIPGSGEIGDVLSIRERVFVDEQGFSAEIERDEHDAYAWHVLLSDDGAPCGAARIFAEEYGVMRVGRICVLKEKRGGQLGDLIMRALLERALRLGAREVRLGAQLPVQAFYEKYGFSASGEIYEEEGCPHVPMSAPREALEALFDCARCRGCGSGEVAHPPTGGAASPPQQA